MSFAIPQFLWLLALPLALLGWEVARRIKAPANLHPKMLRAQAGARSLRLMDPASLPPRKARPRAWLALGLLFGIAALARPQWGQVEEQVFNQAREILIAVDLSRSMLAEDVKPNRLARSKLLIKSLLERLAGERVGLVLFAGTAFVQSPLSADYEILNEFLPEIGPDYLPEGGSNYGALIDASVEAFGSTEAADRFLIVLSDGEATDDDWRSKVDVLKEKGIRVIGLGVGTSDGAIVPDGHGGFVKDERGAAVLSKLGSATLQELSDATAGTYRDASTWIDLPSILRDTVEAGQKGAFQEKARVRRIERFQWALAPALFFLLLSFWREFPVRPRPRAVQLIVKPATVSPARRSTAVTSAALLVFAIILAAPQSTRAAVRAPSKSAPPPPAASANPAVAAPAADESVPGRDPQVVPLTQFVSRLAVQNRRTAADWAELARITIDFGEHFLLSKQPFPDTPIRDALDGVNVGSQLNPKAADWPDLKAKLEDILRRRDEPKEDPPKPPPEKKPEDGQNQDQNQQGGDKDQQQPGPSEQKQDNQQPNPGESKDQDQQNQKPSDPDRENRGFGDMNENVPPPPPQTSQDTQKVGGNPQTKQEDPGKSDPNLAIPLQKLEQIRDQDSPAILYQLMDNVENPARKPAGKDW